MCQSTLHGSRTQGRTLCVRTFAYASFWLPRPIWFPRLCSSSTSLIWNMTSVAAGPNHWAFRPAVTNATKINKTRNGAQEVKEKATS
ncbi:hypothetical protein INR49_032284 [Caranx melampygus]|nr:hypothetical protein INR49_032284 [Caranx melampygus]